MVYDPELTVGTPVQVTAETSLNALAHCVEAAYAVQRSPEAEAVALAGVRAIHDALPRVVDDPSSLEARTDLLAGAALAGRALQNATMGVHHGLSQQLGGRTGIPHGLANAIVLPHAMAFNAEAVGIQMTLVGAALGDADDPPGAAARLVERLGRDPAVGQPGRQAEDLDAVARLSQENRSVMANPRPVSEADARAILEAAL